MIEYIKTLFRVSAQIKSLKEIDRQLEADIAELTARVKRNIAEGEKLNRNN
jgi:hypothetical protein